MKQDAVLNLMNQGWTYKERFIDKDPAKGLLGIRLTNAAKIWDESFSIQIFSRNEVTLSRGGITNDDHVTLTTEDGRDFLEWVRVAHPDILSAEIWEKLPEGPPLSAGPPSNDEARSALIQFCASAFPEFFGPGSIGTNGAPFETTLLALLKQVGDKELGQDRLTIRAILMIETHAHEMYKAANMALRRAHERDLPETALDNAKDAFAFLGAAWDNRRRAVEMRVTYEHNANANSPKLPEASFPDAIESGEAWLAIITAMDRATPKLAPIGSLVPEGAHGVRDVSGRELIEADVTPGMLVTIADPNHARFKQIANIYCKTGPGRYSVTFKNESIPATFNLSQLRPIA